MKSSNNLRGLRFEGFFLTEIWGWIRRSCHDAIPLSILSCRSLFSPGDVLREMSWTISLICWLESQISGHACLWPPNIPWWKNILCLIVIRSLYILTMKGGLYLTPSTAFLSSCLSRRALFCRRLCYSRSCCCLCSRLLGSLGGWGADNLLTFCLISTGIAGRGYPIRGREVL